MVSIYWPNDQEELELCALMIDNKLIMCTLASFGCNCNMHGCLYLRLIFILRVKKVIRQKPLFEDPGLNTSAEELLLPLAANELCFLMTCPP